MMLYDHVGREIADEVREIMRAAGYTDLCDAQCKAWAALFIARRVPGWWRGRRLTFPEAMRVGAAFEAELQRARTGGVE